MRFGGLRRLSVPSHPVAGKRDGGRDRSFMSASSLLSIGVHGIQNAHRQLHVSAHNVANVNTPATRRGAPTASRSARSAEPERGRGGVAGEPLHTGQRLAVAHHLPVHRAIDPQRGREPEEGQHG